MKTIAFDFFIENEMQKLTVVQYIKKFLRI